MTTLNALVAQQIQTGEGLDQVPGSIDPTGLRILSAGSRMQSIVTPMTYVATTTGLSVYWDGSNGSQPFQIYRDDGTITSPLRGNVSFGGLTAGTTYYVYMYYNEQLGAIGFVIDNENAVGQPKAAYTAPNLLAAQQCILSGRMPVALGLTSGVKLPSSGSTTGSAGSGGGGSGGRGYAS